MQKMNTEVMNLHPPRRRIAIPGERLHSDAVLMMPVLSARFTRCLWLRDRARGGGVFR